MTTILDATVTEASNKQVILEGDFDSNNLLYDLRIGNKVFLGDQHAVAGEVHDGRSVLSTDDFEDAQHEIAVLKNKIVDLKDEKDDLESDLRSAENEAAELRVIVRQLRAQIEEMKAPAAQ